MEQAEDNILAGFTAEKRRVETYAEIVYYVTGEGIFHVTSASDSGRTLANLAMTEMTYLLQYHPQHERNYVCWGSRTEREMANT